MNRITITISHFIKLSAISSSFQIQKSTPNPFIILSSTFLTSNQPTLRREDLPYAFDCITNIHEAQALFHYMLQMKPKPTTCDYNKLLTTVARTQHYSHVVKMFKELSLLKIPVNEYTMATVVNCYAHLNKVDQGFPIIGYVFKRGYAPDIVTFNVLIKGFFRIGEVDIAVDLFKKLIKGNLYKVSEYTIAIVLNGLAKSGNIVDAVELLKIAEKHNWKLDVACYSVVIDGLCKGSMLKDATEILFRMVDKGILPNVVTYTSFIHGLCNHEKIDFALSILNDLPSKGIYPNVITFTVIIQGLCGNDLFQDVKEILEKMERVGCFPDDATYNVIIKSCLQFHNRKNLHSINLLKQIVGRDFQLRASTFFLLLRQLQVMRSDDHVIKHLIQKLTSSYSVHLMRDSNDESMISSLRQKLISSDTRCSSS